MDRRQQPLELAVVKLQLAKRLGLIGIHAAARCAQLAKAGITEAVFSTHLVDWHVSLDLTQKANDLFFAVSASFHVHYCLG